MKKLPIFLALIILFSPLASAQFGGGNSFGRDQGNFGFLDYGSADDVAGDVTTLITLRATGILLDATPNGRGIFKEACVLEGGREQLIDQILEDYKSNISSLREICDSYTSRAQNFNENICSPQFTDLPVPPEIKIAAQKAGVAVNLSMTPSDIKKICEIEIEEEMKKELEFETKRYKQEAERFLNGCQERQKWDEKRERRDNERREEDERRRNEFDPWGPGPGDNYYPESGDNYYPEPEDDYYPGSGPGQPHNNSCPTVEPPSDCFPCGPEYIDGCATGSCVDCEQPQDQGPWCGDGICNEDAASCEKDCGPTGPEPYCGDGICNTDNCPEDCYTGPVCGNGACEEGEDSFNCEDDCGPPPQEPPPEEPPPEPFCGDGICNEDAATCEADCAASPAGQTTPYNGIISLQDDNPFDNEPFVNDFGPDSFPEEPVDGPGFGPGDYDNFGPPGFGGPDDPFGTGPGFGGPDDPFASRDFGSDSFPTSPDFGPGSYDNFGPGDESYPRPGFGGPEPFPDPFGGPAGPDPFGTGPGGPGFGHGPFDDSDCGSSVDVLVEKMKEYDSSFRPGPEQFATICDQMAFVMGDKLAEMKLQKEIGEESCKLRFKQKKVALEEAANTCQDAIEGSGVKELVTETVNAKCRIIELREINKNDLRNSFRAAVGIFDAAEQSGSVALESTALTLVKNAEDFENEREKTNSDLFATLFGNEDHSRKARATAENYKERLRELDDLEGTLDVDSRLKIKEQIKELEKEIEKTENRADAYGGGIFGIFGRLGAN